MTQLEARRSTILVQHQDPLLNAGVAAALQPIATFDVCQAATDASLEGGGDPDVVVTDYRNALALAEYGSLRKRTRILALTTDDREADIRRALKAGVHGYVVIGGPLDELIEAVSLLAKGGRFLCQSVAQRIADSMTCAPLTRRENEVLRLVVAGDSNKTIARQLGIELGTVKSHISTILTKLGASSRTRAASIAAARGLLDDDASLVDTRQVARPVPRAALSLVA